MPNRRRLLSTLLAIAACLLARTADATGCDGPGPDVPPLLGEALDALSGVENAARRAAGLRKTAVRLASVGAADEALRAAGAVGDGETRAIAMTEIAPILAAAECPSAARAATRRAAAILIGFARQAKRLGNRQREMDLVRRLAAATAAVEGLADGLELLRLGTVEFRRYPVARGLWEPLGLLEAQVDVAVAAYGSEPALSRSLLRRLMLGAEGLRQESWRSASLRQIAEGWMRIGDLGQALRTASTIRPGGIPAKGQAGRWKEARRLAFDRIALTQFGRPEHFDVAALDFLARSSDQEAVLLTLALERRNPAPPASVLHEMIERADRLERAGELSPARRLRLTAATARRLRWSGEPAMADTTLRRAAAMAEAAPTGTSREALETRQAFDVLLPELVVSADRGLQAEAMALLRRHPPDLVARGWAALAISARPLPTDAPAAWFGTALHEWSMYRFARDYLDDTAAVDRARAITDPATRADCLVESFVATRPERDGLAAALLQPRDHGC
ncbi:MAG TPA: hypothetical protein PKA09_12700 [Geminicoccus sp.]|nr:hypothetical protein [Geminicoccus sp.]